MADDENPEVRSAGGEEAPASKKKAGKKNVVKHAPKKKRNMKKMAEKITVKKRIAVKNVVKKGPPKRSAPAAALAHAVKPQATVSAIRPPVPAGQADVQQPLKETDKSQTGRLSVTGASESSQPAATHRFLPKVILLIIVILVGFMFVRPFANKDAAKEQTEMAAPAVEQQAPAVAAEEKAAPAAEAAVAGRPGDVHALREPAVYAEKASEPASPPVPAAPAPELAAPEQAAAEPAPAAVAPATPTTAAANWTDPAAPSAGSRRSRLMGEYEARRKAAWENSRRRYERMRRPMPAPWGVGQGQRLYYVNPYQLRGN
jgi:hypothetical protein